MQHWRSESIALGSLLLIFISTTQVFPGKCLCVRSNSTRSAVPASAAIAEDYQDFSNGNFSNLGLSEINLSVSLNEVDSTIHGELVIDYRNNASMAVTQMPFHVYPSGMQYDERRGRIDILNLTGIDDPELVEGFRLQEERQLLWVDLSSPVSPGDYASLEIEFLTTLPDGGFDRAGEHGNDWNETRIFTFASAYPMPCVYDEYDGWNTDPYLPGFDPFYFDMAFYDFYVQVPEEMVVAATGKPNVIRNEDGRTTFQYAIEAPVREVTFSASRYYETQSTSCNGVNVSTFYLPASAEAWEDDALEQAVQALELYNSTYGIYPYPTLNVVEQYASYGGMEYPCQVYATRIVTQRVIDGDSAPWYLELVIAHEVAHQWWSQLVGNDCVDWGFLDEGLACWSHSYYSEVYYLDWDSFQATRYLDTVRAFTANNGIGCVINQSNLVRAELTGYSDYVKMPLILQKLRLTIGHDAFLSGVKGFLEEYYFRIATPVDLRNSFEQAAGADLDWFFLPWLDNEYLPQYAIQNAVFDPEQSSLNFTVVDLNRELNSYNYAQQVPLVIYGADSETIVEDTAWINGTTHLSYNVNLPPERIRLNYEGYILVALEEPFVPWYETESIQTTSQSVFPLAIAIVASVALAIAIFVWYQQRKQPILSY